MKLECMAGKSLNSHTVRQKVEEIHKKKSTFIRAENNVLIFSSEHRTPWMKARMKEDYA